MDTADADRQQVKGRVLVVDDDANILRMLSGLLQARGHEIAQARSGDDALAKVQSFAPDAVLMDVVMPGRDGIEVCRELKADPATAPIPVLLVTGVRDRGERIRGIEAGANDFIAKPVDAEEVALRVRNAVHMKQMYDELQRRCRELQTMIDLGDSISHMLASDSAAMARMLHREGKS